MDELNDIDSGKYPYKFAMNDLDGMFDFYTDLEEGLDDFMEVYPFLDIKLSIEMGDDFNYVIVEVVRHDNKV